MRRQFQNQTFRTQIGSLAGCPALVDYYTSKIDFAQYIKNDTQAIQKCAKFQEIKRKLTYVLIACVSLTEAGILPCAIAVALYQLAETAVCECSPIV